MWPQCAGDRLPARRREAVAVVAWRAAWRPGATPTLMRNGRCCEYGSAAASWRCPSVLPRPIEPLGCDLLPGRAFRHPAWFVRRARWFEQKERGFFVDGAFVVVLTAWPAAMPYLCRGCVLLEEFMAEPAWLPASVYGLWWRVVLISFYFPFFFALIVRVFAHPSPPPLPFLPFLPSCLQSPLKHKQPCRFS